MSIRITELDAITSLQSGDYIAVDNESTGTHKFDALNIGANIRQNIANTYSSSASYAIGQYCLYDNNLYKCITTISTPEAWNSSHWIQVTVGEGLYEKVDKISGKGLSTNDFTNAYKTKLDGIEDGAEVNVQANWTENDSSKDDYIKNKPENATTSISGFMSASDKQKLDGIEAGAEVNVQPNWAENDSSKDDYIKNKPTIDDALSTSSTNAVENSAIATAINNEATTRENADNALDGRIDTIEEILPNKANINGSYEEMTVGSAEQLISTESMEDSELYIFRKSGNGADIGDRETDMLVGGTVAWNQQFQLTNNTTNQGISFTKGDNGVISTSGTSASSYADCFGTFKTYPNQKTLIALEILDNPNNVNLKIGLNGALGIPNASANSQAVVRSQTFTGNPAVILGGFTSGTDFTGIKFRAQFIDLTAMFGTEIADYIYSLEQANAGDGVAWFRKYFPNPYYAYDAGSLQSVNVASHNMVGFNQWDEETQRGYYDPATGEYSTLDTNQLCSKNMVKCLPNTTYYAFNGSNSSQYNVVYYDANGDYLAVTDTTKIRPYFNATFTTPSDARYFNFNLKTVYGTTYKGDICINLSDTSINGQYFPYESHTYPLDSSVVLRGQYKLGMNNNLYADGDVYSADGSVTRNWSPYTCTGNESIITQQTLTNNKWVSFTLPNAKSLSGVFSPDFVTDMAVTYCNSINTDVAYGAFRRNAYFYISFPVSMSSADIKAWISGKTVIYELATPTTETADPYTNPQWCDANGTEEYVDAGVKNGTRDVAIPVGHITQYIVNLRDKLQHLPFLAKEDGDYFVNQTGTQMSLKKVEGYYEDLTVGVADNLSTDIRTNDQTPYLFRTSGGSVDIGDREYIDSIVGGTIAWNQLCPELNATNYETTYSTVTYSDGVATIVANHNYGRMQLKSAKAPTIISSHKYIVFADAKTKLSHQFYPLNLSFNGVAIVKSSGTTPAINTWESYSIIANAGSGSNSFFYFGDVSDKYTEGDEVQVKNVQIFDLTQMFGSTIADYIYSLEQANTGAGVAYFRKLFPKPYYAYNAGELLSVSGLQSHDMVGFNAFMGVSTTTPQYIGHYLIDDSGTKTANNSYNCFRVRVFPNTTYCMTKSSGTNLGTAANKRFVDGSENFISADVTGWNASKGVFTTPNNCYYVEFSVGASASYDICINLSWDGSRDGEYEPYQKWSYPLDSSLVLRGIPRLDSNNNLYYDGDTYESDGTVTRKYGEAEFGNLTWSYIAQDTYINANLPNAVMSVSAIPNAILTLPYTKVAANRLGSSDKAWTIYQGSLYVKDTSLTETQLRTLLSSGSVVYELATPTTESAEPYTNPQIVDDFGTEEYVIDSTIDVPIPVGHDTDYPINLKSKLEMAPDSPDGDGDYIVRQTNGTNEYVPLIIEDQLPAVPSTDGTYTLTVTIANGEATYSWT